MTTYAEMKREQKQRAQALVKLAENLTARQQRVFNDDSIRYALEDAIKGIELVTSAAEAEMYDENHKRLVYDEGSEHEEADAELARIVDVGEQLLEPLYQLQELTGAMQAALLADEPLITFHLLVARR
jgi:hypothetical protein